MCSHQSNDVNGSEFKILYWRRWGGLLQRSVCVAKVTLTDHNTLCGPIMCFFFFLETYWTVIKSHGIFVVSSSVEDRVGFSEVPGRLLLNKVFHISANKMFEMLFTDSSFTRRFMDVRKITSLYSLFPILEAHLSAGRAAVIF